MAEKYAVSYCKYLSLASLIALLEWHIVLDRWCCSAYVRSASPTHSSWWHAILLCQILAKPVLVNCYCGTLLGACTYWWWGCCSLQYHITDAGSCNLMASQRWSSVLKSFTVKHRWSSLSKSFIAQIFKAIYYTCNYSRGFNHSQYQCNFFGEQHDCQPLCTVASASTSGTPLSTLSIRIEQILSVSKRWIRIR